MWALPTYMNGRSSGGASGESVGENHNSVLSRGRCVEFACCPLSAWVLSGLLHPGGVHMRCMSALSRPERVVRPGMERKCSFRIQASVMRVILGLRKQHEATSLSCTRSITSRELSGTSGSSFWSSARNLQLLSCCCVSYLHCGACIPWRGGFKEPWSWLCPCESLAVPAEKNARPSGRCP